MTYPQFKKMNSLFNDYKESPEIDLHNSIKQTKDLSKLNFYVVMDIINVVKEIEIKFKTIFEEDLSNSESTKYIINLDNLAKERSKIESIIKKKSEKTSSYFTKLGKFNYVSGCYLIATNKKSINFVQNLNLKKRDDVIVIKLNYKKLPKEIDDLCVKFQYLEEERIRKENKEIEDFLNEYNPIPSLIIKDGNFFNIENIYQSGQTVKNYTFYDGFSEENIKNINDLSFLEVLLNNALEKEQFEFCCKIRDRINEVKKSF